MRIEITGASGNSTVTHLRLGSEGHCLVGTARCPPDHGAGGISAKSVRGELTQDAALAPLKQALEGADAAVHLDMGLREVLIRGPGFEGTAEPRPGGVAGALRPGPQRPGQTPGPPM